MLYGVAGVLVAVAIALTALRLALAYAPAFHGELEALLTQWLHRPVAIAALDAHLVGFTPTLVLHEVRIGGTSKHPADLATSRFEVSIDLGAMLRSLQPRFVELRADRLEVTLRRHADGRISLGEQASDAGNRLFALISRLRLRDASVKLIDQRRGKIWRLSKLHAWFWHDAGDARLAAHFLPVQPHMAKRMELAVGWHGSPRSLAEVNGSGYLRLREARFGQIGAVLSPVWSVPVVAGQADAQVWLSVRGGRPERVSVDASAWGLELSGAEGTMRFRRLAGRGHWQRTDDGWNLDINALQLQRPGAAPGSPGNVSVRYAINVEGAALWRVRATALRLGDLAALARDNDRVPSNWRRRLAQLAPQGALSEAALVLQATDRVQRWRVSGRFQGLALEPAERLPGLTGGAGRFLISERGGRFRLAARDTNLKLPELFSRPLALQRLQVQSEWRVSEGRLRLAIPRLQASDAGGELDARVGLWFGARQGPFIDARAHLRHGEAAHIRRYLPERVLAKGLTEWLQHAIHGGRVQADLVLRGRLHDFPYRTGSGVFEVRSRIDEASLAYHPNWPMLHGLGGRLLFRRGVLRVELDRGRIYRSGLTHATATIPDLMQPRLKVSTHFTGPGGDLLRFLGESPLADDHAAALRRLSLAGQQRLDLQLAVPFGGRPIKVAGRIDLDRARLAAPPLGLVIEDLTGRVGFDENGVHWDRLRGRFSGHTLMSTAATTGAPRRIRIETRFRSSVADLLGADNPLAAQLPGTTDWRLRIEGNGFRSTERRLVLTLESALRGVSVNWPQPLAKPQSTSRQLKIRTRLDAAAGRGPIRVRYGDLGSAVLTLTSRTWSVERLGVRFGSGPVRLPKGPGTELSGTLEQLDLAALIGLGSGQETLKLPSLQSVDLRLGTLFWADARLVSALHLSAEKRSGDWFIRLAGPNAAGWVSWPQQGMGRARVSLARLHLAGWPEFGTERDRLAPNALRLPGIDLDIAALRLGTANFGHLRLSLARVSGGLVLETMNLTGPVLKIKAAGRWDDNEPRGHSTIELNVASEDTGKALTLFGFAQAIGKGKTNAQAHLQWPGTLLDFRVADIAGRIRFTVRDGALLKVQPGAGRIFGLLSVATLPRRLMLDFSDLFSKGLAFDRMEVHCRLESGAARPEVFYIDSPSAYIEVSGPIDLVKREYDQTVTVIPHVSSAVSLLGGLAGGPIVGVALFLTQKLFQTGMAQMVQNQYRITGPWEHPRIEGMGQARAEVPGGRDDSR
ncbi:probable transmembrane protein [Nitrococcus mobilis Nb-231]|uniref:Probable transmembrane protein n=1 Tax=Nitrococcus mobilis Nb-231 TaxID=314278 RepID=A4BQN1_9GAMM|nr:probable transmembrane protein [Nitrococcus mobilis Nb-231]